MNNNHTSKLTFPVLILFFFANFLVANPILTIDDFYIIIENKEIIFSVDNEANEKFFISSTFSTENKTISLETAEKITFLQVMNEHGSIEYQIPIHSQKIHMDISDFKKGTYRLNLLVESTNEYISTQITKIF